MDIQGYEIDGAADLAKALRGWSEATGDLKAVHKQAADTVLSAVRPPRVTGRLAASGRTSGQAKTGVIRYGKASVPYAGPIHWGWPKRGIAANRFMLPALDRKEPAVIEIYAAGLDDLRRRHGL